MSGPLSQTSTDDGMRERIDAFDWAATPLGPPSEWPQSLRTAVRIVLTSRFAMWMAWGPELTFFYNDAYRATRSGAKHPWALGGRRARSGRRSGRTSARASSAVLETGDATWDEALLLFLERSGYPEETYHTFSYSPLADDDGDDRRHAVRRHRGDRARDRRAADRDAAGPRRRRSARRETEHEVFARSSAASRATREDLPFTLDLPVRRRRRRARRRRAPGRPGTRPPDVVGPVDRGPWPLRAAERGASSRPRRGRDAADGRVAELAAARARWSSPLPEPGRTQRRRASSSRA